MELSPTRQGPPAEQIGRPSPPPWRIPRIGDLGLVGVILLLAAVLSIHGWTDEQPGNAFLNRRELIEGVATPMAVYAIMAVGATCVIIAGGIDISVGAVFALSALIAGSLLERFAPDAPGWKVLPVALLVPPAIGLGCGLLNGFLVVGLRVHPFIVTLGTMSVFRGLGNVMTPQKRVPSFGGRLPDAFTEQFMRWEAFDQRVMPMIIMLVCVFVGFVYLRLTVAGRENYAVGGNEEAARFSGLNVAAVKLRVYAISGLCAGVAGMVSLGRFATISTNTATGYELMVIAAAVVGGASLAGGRGSALGALLGTLVIALIQDGIYILRLNEEYRTIIVGAAIIVAVAIDRLSEHLRSRQAGRRRHA